MDEKMNSKTDCMMAVIQKNKTPRQSLAAHHTPKVYYTQPGSHKPTHNSPSPQNGQLQIHS